MQMVTLGGNHVPGIIHDELEDTSSSDGEEELDTTDALLRRDIHDEVERKPRQNHTRFIVEMLRETLPTLVLSTIGLTFTGQLVEVVADWTSMTKIDELFILIPVLNNMKGNLEMNLSSRLSTSAFLGDLDHAKSRKSIIKGNLLLLQVQALMISALAGGMSFLLGFITEAGVKIQPQVTPSRRSFPRGPHRPKPLPSHVSQRPSLSELLMVVATSMTSASLSAASLGSFMCTLVVLCRKFGVNPDNVTPPIASALGDLLTLCILSVTSILFLPLLNTVVPLLIIAALFLWSGGAAFLASKNSRVSGLIGMGWTPLVGAMLITSASGLVLDNFVNKYEGFGLLAIVISGLPGGVGSVFISRISTALHAASESGHVSDDDTDSRLLLVGGTLFAVTFPVQALFLLFLHLSGWMELQLGFVFIFMLVFSVAVILSLSIANFLTHFLWSRNLDPDMYAMPIQSSLVDLIGQCLLVGCYELATMLGGHLAPKSPH